MMSRTLQSRWNAPDLSAFDEELDAYLNRQNPLLTLAPMRSQKPPQRSSEELAKLAPGNSSRPPIVGSVPTGDMAAQVRDGLIKRGMSDHVADAFLMNFQDESGMNPGINERNPIVAGSRGGYGLYQLTGPRRTAYESFASQRDVPFHDVDAQLDFMMSELQGPESRAAKAIFNAPDRGTAAAAIVTDFLRPSPEHRTRRVAKYKKG